VIQIQVYEPRGPWRLDERPRPPERAATEGVGHFRQSRASRSRSIRHRCAPFRPPLTLTFRMACNKVEIWIKG
jgi:hypothetical protein